MKILSRYSEHSYAILRIMAGFMLMFHGLEKIFGIFGAEQPPMGSQFWFGGVIELTCGLLVMLGFQARWAAFLASGTMAVAYFQFHWRFQLGADFFPIVNKGELAVLYCFVFLLIACRGAVKWGIDKK